MSERMLTVLVATVAAIVGTMILGAVIGGPNDREVMPAWLLITIIPASVIYWSYVGYTFRKSNAGATGAVIFGVLSPFMGGILAGAPFYGVGAAYGFLIAAAYAGTVIPIGVATGLVVWLVNRQSAI